MPATSTRVILSAGIRDVDRTGAMRANRRDEVPATTAYRDSARTVARKSSDFEQTGR